MSYWILFNLTGSIQESYSDTTYQWTQPWLTSHTVYCAYHKHHKTPLELEGVSPHAGSRIHVAGLFTGVQSQGNSELPQLQCGIHIWEDIVWLDAIFYHMSMRRTGPNKFYKHPTEEERVKYSHHNTQRCVHVHTLTIWSYNDCQHHMYIICI